MSLLQSRTFQTQIVTSPAKQQFSICTFSESYAAKASETAGHKQDHYKKFNSLMQQYSAEASELATQCTMVRVFASLRYVTQHLLHAVPLLSKSGLWCGLCLHV